MRRRTHNPEDAIGGQDSFLDIVANLVGILIILVVIVSAQARSVSKEVVDAGDLETQFVEKKTELKQLRSQVTKMTVDNHELEKDIVEEKRLTKSLADERHVKLMLLEQASQKIESETAEWDSYRKKDFDAQEKITDLKQQLTETQREVAAWENRVAEMEINRVEEIEHFPTPIAKTVFTEEVHFRLSGGRISYVPLDELVDKMKAQWNVVAEELASTNQTISTVGPLNNYRLQYKLVKSRSAGNGNAVPREVIKFDRFVIIPTVEELGEPVNDQLLTQSQFLRQLTGRRPEKTTISIWVYPDSFGELAKLKQHLHEEGFQVASWPLEFNRPISGGPNGFKTSAQ